VPSAEKSKALGLRFGSGSVASSLTLGVQASHRLEDEAESKAWAVKLAPYNKELLF
jgi:hypothetical protein